MKAQCKTYNDDCFKEIPEDEDNVEVVLDVEESRSTGVLDNGASDGTGKVTDCSTLGTGGGAEGLGDVHALKRSPAEAEDDAEDVDEGDGRVGSSNVARIVRCQFRSSRDDCEAE